MIAFLRDSTVTCITVSIIIAAIWGTTIRAQEIASQAGGGRITLSRFQWGDGVVEMFSTKASISQMPKWTNPLESPPVACHEAIGIATRWVDANRAGTPPHTAGYQFIGASVAPLEREHWYWRITFELQTTSAATTGVPNVISIAVMMDRSVPQIRRIAEQVSTVVSAAEFDGFPVEMLKYFSKREVRGGQVEVSMDVEMYRALPAEYQKLLPKAFLDEWKINSSDSMLPRARARE